MLVSELEVFQELGEDQGDAAHGGINEQDDAQSSSVVRVVLVGNHRGIFTAVKLGVGLQYMPDDLPDFLLLTDVHLDGYDAAQYQNSRTLHGLAGVVPYHRIFYGKAEYHDVIVDLQQERVHLVGEPPQFGGGVQLQSPRTREYHESPGYFQMFHIWKKYRRRRPVPSFVKTVPERSRSWPVEKRNVYCAGARLFLSCFQE